MQPRLDSWAGGAQIPIFSTERVGQPRNKFTLNRFARRRSSNRRSVRSHNKPNINSIRAPLDEILRLEVKLDAADNEVDCMKLTTKTELDMPMKPKRQQRSLNKQKGFCRRSEDQIVDVVPFELPHLVQCHAFYNKLIWTKSPQLVPNVKPKAYLQQVKSENELPPHLAAN